MRKPPFFDEVFRARLYDLFIWHRDASIDLSTPCTLSNALAQSKHSSSGSELHRACHWLIHTMSAKGVRGSQPALSNSGFLKK